MGLIGIGLSRYVFPKYEPPPNTVLISEPVVRYIGWPEITAVVLWVGAKVGKEILDLPYITGQTKFYRQHLTPLDWVLAGIEVSALIFIFVRLVQHRQREQVVLTTTDLHFVKHGRAISSCPLHLLRGVMAVRKSGTEPITHWVAMFEHGPNIKIYANHRNGKEIADSLTRMLPMTPP